MKGDPEALEARLLGLADRLLAENAGVPGVVLEVEAPRLGFALSRARGVTRFGAGGVALTPAHPLRLASNTKTYVAAAVLRLVEEGRLALDEAVAGRLPAAQSALLRAGGYDPGAITLRHLLTHTSGLYDFGDSPDFNTAVLAGRHWTRLEQLAGAMEWGRPYGVPGEVYRYSDTGYVLLGEILERTTGDPSYGGSLRRLLDYERLGLAATWLESLEPWPAGVPERAQQYLGERPNEAFDVTTDLFGGGGLIAQLGDVRRFYAALFRGEVFRRRETLALMLTTVAAERGGPAAYGMVQQPGEYRMGIFVRRLGGLDCYSHGGYFGTQAAYFPGLDASVALGVNLADSDLDGDLLAAVAAVLRDSHA